jgi:hypothetical protein
LGRLEGSLLAPAHLGGIGASEVDATAGARHFGPEAGELAQYVRDALAHAGVRVAGPVLNEHLFDVRGFATVSL